MTGTDIRAIRVRITGRVQGVGFRAWTRRQAERRGLAGWVRNEPDGSVAALIAGPRAAVEAMVGLLHAGPPGAAVAGVEIGEADASDVGRDFAVRRW
jgi:acylphosphatase